MTLSRSLLCWSQVRGIITVNHPQTISIWKSHSTTRDRPVGGGLIDVCRPCHCLVPRQHLNCRTQSRQSHTLLSVWATLSVRRDWEEFIWMKASMKWLRMSVCRERETRLWALRVAGKRVWGGRLYRQLSGSSQSNVNQHGQEEDQHRQDLRREK